MSCDRLKRQAWSITPSDDDSNYQTDNISVGDDARDQPRSQLDVLSGDEASEDEHARSPELYQTHVIQVNNTKTTNIYANSTTLQFEKIESQWRRYCQYIGKDPVELMASITLGDVSGFFAWKLDQKRGTEGKRLRGTREASSLATYRKQFLIVYRKLVGKDIDSEMVRETLNLMISLANDRGLSRTPQEKPPMDAQDVLEITQTDGS